MKKRLKWQLTYHCACCGKRIENGAGNACSSLCHFMFTHELHKYLDQHPPDGGTPRYRVSEEYVPMIVGLGGVAAAAAYAGIPYYENRRYAPVPWPGEKRRRQVTYVAR